LTGGSAAAPYFCLQHAVGRALSAPDRLLRSAAHGVSPLPCPHPTQALRLSTWRTTAMQRMPSARWTGESILLVLIHTCGVAATEPCLAPHGAACALLPNSMPEQWPSACCLLPHCGITAWSLGTSAGHFVWSMPRCVWQHGVVVVVVVVCVCVYVCVSACLRAVDCCDPKQLLLTLQRPLLPPMWCVESGAGR
jgi:hypothetical protein